MKKILPFGKKLFLLLSFLLAGQLYAQQPLLDPVLQPKFVNPLPFPAVLQPTKGVNQYEVIISQFDQDLLGLKDASGNPLMTTVWGYNGSYPGPTIEATSGEAITVDWINELPEKHLFAIDENVHWAGNDMGGKLPGPNQSFNGIPTITHLHGGHTDADSDGHPESWYTPKHKYTGSNYYNNKGEFTYDNSQEAATLWYHDHTIGITRLNVYAGLAGFYLLRDSWENSLDLPKGEFEVPLVIQDRSFDINGQLVYDNMPQYTVLNPLPGQPTILYNSILPETFGEFILVNGKTWPYLDVQPRKYRLRFLNGSDSRFYNLKIPGVNFNQIGSDGGLLPAPVLRNTLLIGPGERIDVIVDFSTVPGQNLIMKNTARSPFPFGAVVNPQTSGQIMAFRVGLNLTAPDLSKMPTSLRNSSAIVSQAAVNTISPRKLVLFEQVDEYGRLLPSLGTAEEGAKSFMADITENPDLGATEEWQIYNTTPDAHPIHLHLVHFQVLSTQKFDVKRSVFGTSLAPLTTPVIKLQGSPKPPAPENAGRKDTFIVYPGEVAKVKAYFDKEGEYVWHCHILSHEDHDMMRPLYVGQLPQSPFASMQTIALTPVTLEAYAVAPNPMLDQTQISFRMNEDSQVLLEIYDFTGKRIVTLYDDFAASNQDYSIMFDRSGLPSGTYISKLSTADGRSTEKFIMAQ